MLTAAPDSPAKTRSSNTSRATFRGHRESITEANSKFLCPNASNNKKIRFIEKAFFELGALYFFVVVAKLKA